MLSAEETLILRFLSVGMQEKEIAVLMNRSSTWVSSVTKATRRKIRAKNQAHAVAIALREGWID